MKHFKSLHGEDVFIPEGYKLHCMGESSEEIFTVEYRKVTVDVYGEIVVEVDLETYLKIKGGEV